MPGQAAKLLVSIHHFKASIVGTHSGRAASSAATVDELADAVAVVGEIDGEVGLGAGVAVGADEGGEVVGDSGGLVVGHARSTILVTVVGTGEEGRGQRGNGEEAGGNGERAHFGGIRGMGLVLCRME